MKEAVSKAYSILNQLNINTIPVDVENIANKLNCEIHRINPINLPDDFPCDKTNFAGAIIQGDNGKHHILVNIYDPYERQRFTIAHELGHLLLDNTETIDCRESIFSNSEKELRANEFAGSLLMPKEWLEEVIKIVDDNDKLANLFQVSRQAIEIRRKNLGL